MSINTKRKALLSINPTFNCQFLDNNVFAKQHSLNYSLIGRNSQQNIQKAVDYGGQKSEPAALQGNKRYDRPGEVGSLLKPKSKSVVYMKLKSASECKDANKFYHQIAIDSKREGKAYRIRNYGRWALN